MLMPKKDIIAIYDKLFQVSASCGIVYQRLDRLGFLLNSTTEIFRQTKHPSRDSDAQPRSAGVCSHV